MSTPEIQVTLCTSMNMGDHAAELRIAHLVEPGETVEHLLMRVMELGEFKPRFCQPKPAWDWIELRYVAGTEPTPENDGREEGPF